LYIAVDIGDLDTLAVLKMEFKDCKVANTIELGYKLVDKLEGKQDLQAEVMVSK